MKGIGMKEGEKAMQASCMVLISVTFAVVGRRNFCKPPVAATSLANGWGQTGLLWDV